eukprot:83148-Prorocentrum_minimum.AAC.2
MWSPSQSATTRRTSAPRTSEGKPEVRVCVRYIPIEGLGLVDHCMTHALDSNAPILFERPKAY